MVSVFWLCIIQGKCESSDSFDSDFCTNGLLELRDGAFVMQKENGQIIRQVLEVAEGTAGSEAVVEL